ncbi:hypothetical protein ACF046_07510 [Glutamicibacter creatinolyticus]|uniref:hypothetical protein n=1 Tax=Glutamicibacter creatinolyticus TaxID=162496 RepID=UPI0033C2E314
MDFASLLVLGGIITLCLLPVVFGSFKSLDRHADDLEGRDQQTARSLRKARRDIDRGKGWYGP